MKTHFQADQTTLQNVSELGGLFDGNVDVLDLTYETFAPEFTLDKKKQDILKLQELIIQSAIRQNISEENTMKKFLNMINVTDLDSRNLEVLGEKALPQGHVDILIKEATPTGMSKKIVIETKIKATKADLEQVKSYVEELDKECISGILIASNFQKKLIEITSTQNLKLIKYSLDKLEGKEKFSFDDLKENIEFELVE